MWFTVSSGASKRKEALTITTTCISWGGGLKKSQLLQIVRFLATIIY